MFSTGQIIFSICFFVAFVWVIRSSYKKDKAIHQKHFKGKRWVLIGFLAFFLLLLLAKIWLKQ